MDVRGKRIFVGLSGGVDSAVTAALLKQQGADVTGVFIKGWYPPGMPCTWSEDRQDAMRVAAHLGIGFHTLEASDAYKQGVIDYLLKEYKQGRTPNPDIMCNREVKFGAFYAFARSHEALIATGHYARVDDGVLMRGVDPDKDQSYFLWAVPKDALTHTLFPLGAMHKAKTRELAQAFKLPNARKRDSQGICFLGNISIDDFLRREFETVPGEAYDEHGTVVGTHGGALLYTLGERIALTNAVPGPWYVITKDIELNTVTVSTERKVSSASIALHLEETEWNTEPEEGSAVTAQFRYHGPLVSGTYTHSTFTPRTALPEPAASGQSLVIYDGDCVRGGGIIV